MGTCQVLLYTTSGETYPIQTNKGDIKIKAFMSKINMYKKKQVKRAKQVVANKKRAFS